MGDSLSGLTLDTVSGAYSKYSNTTVDTNGDDQTAYMDFDSYLKVLASQMSNQDFNNPMSDSEMLQQMASYSMLEGIKTMTSQANISYASSLVGKAVTVDNGTDITTGIVDSITVSNSTPYLVVNGKQYEASSVTDISDSDVYSQLAAFIGHSATAKVVTADETESSASGKITDVMIKGGNLYVIINDTLYDINNITLDSSEDSDAASDKTAESTDKITDTTDTAEAGDLSTETATVSTESVLADYAMQSDKLFDQLISTTDSLSKASVREETMVEEYPELSQFNVSYISTPDYASGALSTADRYLANAADNLQTLSVTGTSGVQGIPSVSADTVNAVGYSSTYPTVTSSATSASSISASDVDALARSSRNGRISSVLTNAQAKAVLASGEYNSRYSAKYGLELQSDSKAGVSISDCVPHRRNPGQYPEEEALADAYGTRMYDVSYIHNTAITSRIDTSTVIGTTVSGREFTELGFSGQGQLGEVVTFADGTQRVEVIYNNGHSGWFETSGRYTLDEICGNTAYGYEQSANFTPVELAIRNYAN